MTPGRPCLDVDAPDLLSKMREGNRRAPVGGEERRGDRPIFRREVTFFMFFETEPRLGCFRSRAIGFTGLAGLNTLRAPPVKFLSPGKKKRSGAYGIWWLADHIRFLILNGLVLGAALNNRDATEALESAAEAGFSPQR